MRMHEAGAKGRVGVTACDPLSSTRRSRSRLRRRAERAKRHGDPTTEVEVPRHVLGAACCADGRSCRAQRASSSPSRPRGSALCAPPSGVRFVSEFGRQDARQHAWPRRTNFFFSRWRSGAIACRALGRAEELNHRDTEAQRRQGKRERRWNSRSSHPSPSSVPLCASVSLCFPLRLRTHNSEFRTQNS